MKPGVADCRESPAIEVMKHLRRNGAAVAYADPYVSDLTLDTERLAAVPLTDLGDTTPWWSSPRTPRFNLELVRREAALVLDTRAAVPTGPNVFRAVDSAV